MTEFGKALWIAYMIVILVPLVCAMWRSVGEE